MNEWLTREEYTEKYGFSPEDVAKESEMISIPLLGEISIEDAREMYDDVNQPCIKCGRIPFSRPLPCNECVIVFVTSTKVRGYWSLGEIVEDWGIYTQKDYNEFQERLLN
jgi:hypothetical protein